MRSIIALVLVVFCGCASVDITRLDESLDFPAIPVENVQVYNGASQVPGRYVEMALLHVPGDSPYLSDGEIEKMRERAANIGANGIILADIGARGESDGGLFCPVMGARLAEGQVAESVEYKGNTYRFCCKECKPKFLADPEKYAIIAEAPTDVRGIAVFGDEIPRGLAPAPGPASGGSGTSGGGSCH